MTSQLWKPIELSCDVLLVACSSPAPLRENAGVGPTLRRALRPWCTGAVREVEVLWRKQVARVPTRQAGGSELLHAAQASARATRDANDGEDEEDEEDEGEPCGLPYSCKSRLVGIVRASEPPRGTASRPVNQGRESKLSRAVPCAPWSLPRARIAARVEVSLCFRCATARAPDADAARGTPRNLMHRVTVSGRERGGILDIGVAAAVHERAPSGRRRGTRRPASAETTEATAAKTYATRKRARRDHAMKPPHARVSAFASLTPIGSPRAGRRQRRHAGATIARMRTLTCFTVTLLAAGLLTSEARAAAPSSSQLQSPGLLWAGVGVTAIGVAAIGPGVVNMGGSCTADGKCIDRKVIGVPILIGAGVAIAGGVTMIVLGRERRAPQVPLRMPFFWRF